MYIETITPTHDRERYIRSRSRAKLDSVFIRGLSLFKTRTAYANIVNDQSVPYYTAAISQYDPYVDMRRLNLFYLPSFSPVILHPSRPVIILTKPKDPVLPSQTRPFAFSVSLILLAPLWTTFFVLVSLYQSFLSTRRIRQHLRLGECWGTSQETSSNEFIREALEDVVDDVSIVSVADHREQYTPFSNGGEWINETEVKKSTCYDREEFRLDLPNDQLRMMDGLRRLSWRIFEVHIHKTIHSHAAIIRRTRWSNELFEGEIVIRHWLKGQFEV